MKYIPNALGSGFLLNEILVMFFIPMSKRFSTVTIYFKICVPFSSAIKMASDLIKISINMKRVKMNLFDKSIFKF